MPRYLLTALVLTGLIAGGLARAQAGEKVHVGRRWAAGEQVALNQVDHAAWTSLLTQYVDDAGTVDYAAWKSSTADRGKLQGYLADLSRGRPSPEVPRAAVLAFWINAYNAVTVEGILREYPTSSIRNHTPRLIGYHIWHDLILPVGQGEYSLHQIEHEQLRPLGDPRIHFALVCASKGCPRLARTAYTADDLDRQLDDNAKAFFADPSKFGYDTAAKRLDLSWILSYYTKDFAPDAAGLLRFVARYFPSESARLLASDPAVTVRTLPYDWSLNGR